MVNKTLLHFGLSCGLSSLGVWLHEVPKAVLRVEGLLGLLLRVEHHHFLLFGLA